MNRQSQRVLVLGPDPWCARLLPALDDLGLEPSFASLETADAIVVHADHGGPGEGPARLRELLSSSGAVGIGAAPSRDLAVHGAFESAGAVEILATGASPREAARRVERALAFEALARRVRQQDLELILVSSLARRLLRAPDAETLLVETMDVLGRTLALERAEARTEVDQLPATGALAIAWTPSGRARATERPELAPLEREALLGRSPVRTAVAGREIVLLPLVSRGAALAALRLEGGADTTFDAERLSMLFGVGNLLAEALAHAERVAQLRGRSRDLEQLAAERARETEEQRALFQAVIDALPVSLHAIDRDYRIVVWNRNRESGPLGRPRGEVLGRHLFSAIGTDPGLRLEYEELFRTAEPRSTEVVSTTDGCRRQFVVEKMPMRLGGDGEVSHVITVARDVTAQRSFERAVNDAEKMAAIGRLAAGIAHEINNPLATIAGCAEALKSRLCEPLDEGERNEAVADAGLIEDEAYRCKEILGGLLDFSRSAPDARGPCEPVELLRRAVRLLRHNPRATGTTLAIDVAGAPPPIVANEDQLLQVLLVLVLNAADATGHGGHITLSAAPHGDGGVRLSVEDDGPGIPPDIKERIFEPFFTTKPAGHGTGLGLSLAYGIIKAHGGRLDVHSTPGHGARFDVVLLAEAPLPEAAAAPREPELTGATR